MTLLIGSVYANGNNSDLEWLAIQKHFLETTTENYKLVGVVPHPIEGTTISDYIQIIAGPKEQVTDVIDAHVYGLRALKNYFEANQDKYDHLLFLDSDAFPIKRGWQKLLDRLTARRFEIACVVRCELLETRLHVCVIYAKPESLPYLDFHSGVPTGADGPKKCILTTMYDQGPCPIRYEENRRDRAFPLLKSNQFTEDPLTGTIYYDMFYHHGSGSRKKKTRANRYWRHMIKSQNTDLKKRLLENPNETIAKLAGWNPKSYGGLG